MRKIWGPLIAGLAATLFLAGCGTVTSKRASEKLTVQQLQTYANSVLDSDELALFSVPYMIDRNLVKIARGVETFGRTKSHQAKKLAVMLLADGNLRIKYSRNSNYTAREVYEQRKANCISYTNLFIGMARALRINAQYAEVTEIDSFEKVGDTVVYNSHICAVVYDGLKPYLIDFSLADYPQYHLWHPISDLEAAAGFYNNIGSEILLGREGQDYLERAETYFTMAYKLYPDSPQAYNNLGVLEMEQGKFDEAERRFRRALAIRPGYFAAYNNLGSIYMRRGETSEAIRLVQESIIASPRNKFALNTLARLQISASDYLAAEANLRKALRFDKRFTEARHELGKLYMKLGRGREALEQFALALRYQPDDDIARNKMELIRKLALEQ